MQSKISFIILDQAGDVLAELTIPKVRLILTGLLATVFFLVTFWIYIDYSGLKQSTAGIQELKALISHQRNEISYQRRQIQTFANNIKRLKTQLLALEQSGRAIKSLAGIERKDGRDGRIGIGGESSDGSELNFLQLPKTYHEMNLRLE